MATSFAIPPTFAQPADPYHQYSPLSSAHATPSNSANISPTSPHKSFYNAPHLSRQLRQPKSPLYVPAVLRPTEKPTRPYPMTPPASAQNSFEGKSSMRGMDGINRRMTNTSVSSGISRVVSDEWNDEALGKVSGATTKNHWKPDSSAIDCSDSACDRSFSFTVRRHHCRRCGNIFCSTHSLYSVPLDQHARFHPEGNWQRACESCFSDFRAWSSARHSRSNSYASNNTDETATPALNTGNSRSAMAGVMGPDGMRVGSVAASVPKDWNWSTF
ncbi:hypothetical protein B0A49_04846 [Cryomyces minteri]|uniref:FYVE-type domain-containing protein n=1 Tax=Cryomyces minteri TaxID=331657 RepID=A0A4U0XHI4_9PEZI|nr:hypothetical protein B0A49_04846 [Cryomyces minteri]